MLRLTREVRFAVNATPDAQLSGPPANSFGGFPSLTGAGPFFALQVTVAGALDPRTSYLLNIKRVDEAVRRDVVPAITQLVRDGRFGGGAGALRLAHERLRNAFAGVTVERTKLVMTPFFALELRAPELPMLRLSQRFEFSASHRLHNPQLSDEQNYASFGKCSNPHGHGHNYELQVTLSGEPDANGVLIDVPAFERIVSSTVIERFDHRNLNVEVEEFRELIPSVENIARVIYRMLQPKLQSPTAQLAAVTVWETPKTWCEYSE